MTNPTIAQRARDTIARVLNCDAVQDSDRLREDLGMIEHVNQYYVRHGLNEWSGADLFPSELDRCQTVGDVVAMMERKAQ